MNRTWTLAALAALTLGPLAATAQETPRARPRPRVRTQVERTPFSVFSFSGNRGRIGVVVKTVPDAADDKVGARIEAVSPDGPAAKAGLKAGDILTRFNGTALGGVAAANDDESGPGMKLIELARALDPGDTVQVEYRRGSETRKAALVAEEVGATAWTGIEGPDFPFRTPMPDMEFGPGNHFEWMMGAPWGGIELVSLNPDLGEYFGTREGVLVVRTPEDSTLTLKGGDVILAIGGRKPTSPMHAMRILRSYDSGETVSIEVLRKQKRTTIGWKVPESEERFHLAPGTRRRERQEPSLYHLLPKLRMAPLMAKVARAHRVI